MSNTGSIHDIASDMYDREIEFGDSERYAVVLAAYYVSNGGTGYTTHKTAEAAARASRAVADYSHCIIDSNGNTYVAYGDALSLVEREGEYEDHIEQVEAMLDAEESAG